MDAYTHTLGVKALRLSDHELENMGSYMKLYEVRLFSKVRSPLGSCRRPLYPLFMLSTTYRKHVPALSSPILQ